MSTARVRFLETRARMFRAPAPEEKIREQLVEIEPLLDRSIDPRAVNHLDTTKLALHRERVEAWMRGERVAPITIDMALTQKCSYACTFCYAGLQQNPQAPVPWDAYERFLDDCAEIGVKAISLVSDGESTENPDFVRFILKAKSVGIDVASGTNGLKLRELEKIVPALSYLRFNFNAATPARYAEIMGATIPRYEQVVANIREAVAIKHATGADCSIGLQQVLLAEYADEVIPTALLGRELGVDFFIIKHCSDDESGRLGVDYEWYRSDLAKVLFRAAEALSTTTYSVQAKWSKFRTGRDREYSRCYGTALHLQMSGSGIVAPCGSFFNERYERFHIGDIRTQRFRDIVQSERYWEVMGYLKSDEFDPRKQCATLCLQDRSNLALFNAIHNGADLPHPGNVKHTNFL